MQRLGEVITDTLLFTYYYLELENSKIPVLLPRHPALCIYFYPTSPSLPLPPLSFTDVRTPKMDRTLFRETFFGHWNNQTEDGTPVGIHPR